MKALQVWGSLLGLFWAVVTVWGLVKLVDSPVHGEAEWKATVAFLLLPGGQAFICFALVFLAQGVINLREVPPPPSYPPAVWQPGFQQYVPHPDPVADALDRMAKR
jgi:hypothetical protein